MKCCHIKAWGSILRRLAPCDGRVPGGRGDWGPVRGCAPALSLSLGALGTQLPPRGRAGERARCRACVLCVRLSVSCCNLQITKEENKNREENLVAVAAVAAAEHLASSVIAQELEEREQKQERRPRA
jgi:hypothetical protein